MVWKSFDFQAFQPTSWNIRNFFRKGFVFFLCPESYFMKYMKFFRVFIPWNIRRFHFLKYRKSFFIWKNVRNFFGVSVSWNIRHFLILELESSIFLKYKKFPWHWFFLFFELWLKSAVFHFRKYNKSFLLRKYKKYFNLRARKFVAA